MYPYRLWFKDSTNITGVNKAECRCLEFNLNRDLLSDATSTFEVEKVPDGVVEGDILGLRNPYGNSIYYGVVKSIDDTSIQCNQIETLFDIEWIYRKPDIGTIEQDVADILTNDFKGNADPLMQKKYNFAITSLAGEAMKLPEESKNKVMNFKSFLYDVYSQYGIRLFFDIPFGQGTPKIEVAKKEYGNYLVSDNVQSVKNVKITQEVAQYNKLLIYSKGDDENTSALRAAYYLSGSGITTDPEVDRISTIKQKIVFSDEEDLNSIVSKYLQEQYYNHLIRFDLIINNKMYDFYKMELGQKIQFHYQGKTYDSILTGYELSKEREKEVTTVALILGKVRLDLDKKLSEFFRKME